MYRTLPKIFRPGCLSTFRPSVAGRVQNWEGGNAIKRAWLCNMIQESIWHKNHDPRSLQSWSHTTIMSWRLPMKSALCPLVSTYGLSYPPEAKENGILSRSITPIPSRPTTPKPLHGSDQFRSGMLTIRIFSGEQHAFLRPNMACSSRMMHQAEDSPYHPPPIFPRE